MNTVSICIPCGSPVNPKVLQHLMALTSYSVNRGIKIANVGITDRVLINVARSTLAKQFLDETDSEWSLWIDDDMVVPINALEHLLEKAKETGAKIMSAMYYQRLAGYNPVCFRNTGGDYKDFSFIDPDKVCEVDGVGFGCILIHRSVFEKIGTDVFRFDYSSGRMMGEDIYFCKKAKEAGFKVMIDGAYKIGHIGAPEIVYRRKNV